jgi:hypothetical protein
MSPLTIAIGPEAPAFGSWEWIGADLCRELPRFGCPTKTFRETVPECDVAVFVKFKPELVVLQELRQRCRLVYCPVDVYGSAAEIDGDSAALKCFERIIVHAERLRRYFAPYASVASLDHHLKFLAGLPSAPRSDGPLLWIGNRSNLSPVIEWVNQTSLTGEVWLLTDFPSEAEITAAEELGFTRTNGLRIGRWTPARHREWTSLARAAFDVKGDDFRARHKPPTKALDFLASGVPLAMNRDSSSTEHLETRYGFRLPGLDEPERWLSADYFHEIQRLAPRLRAELSLERIAQTFLALLREPIHSR